MIKQPAFDFVSLSVFLLIMSLKNTRKIMLRAAALGMTSGDYVFIVPDFSGTSRIGTNVWRRNDPDDVVSDER